MHIYLISICVGQLYKHSMSVCLFVCLSVRLVVWSPDFPSVCPSHFSRRFFIDFSFKFHKFFPNLQSVEWNRICLLDQICQISALWLPKNGYTNPSIHCIRVIWTQVSYRLPASKFPDLSLFPDSVENSLTMIIIQIPYHLWLYLAKPDRLLE